MEMVLERVLGLEEILVLIGFRFEVFVLVSGAFRILALDLEVFVHFGALGHLHHR